MRDIDTREGKSRKIEGKAKQVVGKLTGDTETEAEGAAERMKGNLQEGYGKAKEAFRGTRRGAEE